MNYIESSSTLRIASYNIWNPIFELRYNGQNTWKERLPHLIENIILVNPDILFMQEVGIESYNDLINDPEISKIYTPLYFSHAPKSLETKIGRDGLALFYKEDKLKLNTIQHSVVGSRPTHRRDVYGDFEMSLNENKIHFRVAGTHLEGESLDIGKMQILKLVEDVLNTASLDRLDFVVVTGDFNEGDGGANRPRAEIMEAHGFINDGSISNTRNNLPTVVHKGHVDWIYAKIISTLPVKLKAVEPVGTENSSDHKLIATDFLF